MVIWLLVSIAYGDIVFSLSGPHCPPGSYASGEQCVARPCEAADDCRSGQVCGFVGLCLETVTVTSRRGDRSQVEHATSACVIETGCESGAACDRAMRCMEPPEPKPPPEPAVEADSGAWCGCRTVQGGASGAVGLVLLLFAGRKRR